MQETHSFEYAIIRVVPRVEREEFLNVGVILYCRPHKFLRVLIHLDEQRLKAVSDKIDLVELKRHLHAIEEIANGAADAGPIGKLDMASRFRWLTATRSTIVQSSKVHPGICSDPQEKIAKLFEQYVM
jgi:hypothetical protein